ncbi:MAG: biotin-dependent carboxyltransferase family protein [Pseudomonadota bacterium]
MSSVLEVLACPVPASTQDLGRYGYRHFGVPVSGALDNVSFRLANALVRNPPNAAALEMRLTGPRLRAQAPVRVALAHAEATIECADGSRKPLPTWQSTTLAAGDILKIGTVQGGAGYLAVAGGFDVPAVLGSRATYARAGFGSLLHEGMLLPVGAADLSGPEHAVMPAPTFEAGPIRVIPGPQREMFTDAAFATFISSDYNVTQEADRMGLRLAGPCLRHVAGADIVSDAVTPGAIQVPGDGRPIVLLADCQSVGGYAKIATVIAADLPRLGRLLPGNTLRFAVVEGEQALAALRASEDGLAQIIAGLRPVNVGGVDLEALYQANLVDGVIDAH